MIDCGSAFSIVTLPVFATERGQMMTRATSNVRAIGIIESHSEDLEQSPVCLHWMLLVKTPTQELVAALGGSVLRSEGSADVVHAVWIESRLALVFARLRWRGRIHGVLNQLAGHDVIAEPWHDDETAARRYMDEESRKACGGRVLVILDIDRASNQRLIAAIGG